MSNLSAWPSRSWLNSQSTRSRRFLVTGFAVLSLLLPAAVGNAKTHSLSGNARFQIGNGIPIPIGFSPLPNGKVLAVPGATIRQHGQHSEANPAKVVLDSSQLTHPGTPPVNLPIFQPGTSLFQIQTAIQIQFPKSQVSFAAGGRTGPGTVTFCGKPGSATAIHADLNPACAGSPTGTGLLRYTNTARQFGGPAHTAFGGVADIAFNAGGASPPCSGPPTCIVGFANATPRPTGAVGGPFGFTTRYPPTFPSPGIFFATVGPFGTVVALGQTIAPGLSNTGTSWGGPWTTGMVTASNPTATPPQKFTLTGADARAAGNGEGSLSLVAGGFSQRILTGSKANRGWLNLAIGPVNSHIPAMPAYAVAALVALTALSGAYALRLRNQA
jgi:hypothetical protein